jgi:hypothetical protein
VRGFSFENLLEHLSKQKTNDGVKKEHTEHNSSCTLSRPHIVQYRAGAVPRAAQRRGCGWPWWVAGTGWRTEVAHIRLLLVRVGDGPKLALAQQDAQEDPIVQDVHPPDQTHST